MRNKGHVVTPETRAKIGKANRGRRRSPETRAKMSAAQRIAQNTPEARERHRTAWLGRNHTPETRAKMSAANQGPNHPQFGTRHSEEWKAHIAAGGRGRKHSPETIAKMQESARDRWQRPGEKDRLAEWQGGEKSHFWRGGISREPYTAEWTESLRRRIRERDHYTCQLCGKQQDHATLHVHHVDYDKANCGQRNLISLCARCHLKANVYREYWTAAFQLILRARSQDA